MTRSETIKKAVKALELDKEFPHRHDYATCYSYDGHRSDLSCDHVETPHPCHRCNGTGKYTFLTSNDCVRCRSTGILGGTEEARKQIVDYIDRDLDLDEELKSP